MHVMARSLVHIYQRSMPRNEPPRTSGARLHVTCAYVHEVGTSKMCFESHQQASVRSTRLYYLSRLQTCSVFFKKFFLESMIKPAFNRKLAITDGLRRFWNNRAKFYWLLSFTG